MKYAPAREAFECVAPALRGELEKRLKPGERVLWVQQARPDYTRILLRESHAIWLTVLALAALLVVACPMEFADSPNGGVVLRMGRVSAFLFKNGDITALRSGAVVGCIVFVAGLLLLAWKAFRLSQLRREVYAVTDRRLLILHPFLLDITVDAAPLRSVTLRNSIRSGDNRADIFLTYPHRLPARTPDEPETEVIEYVRLRGIQDPDSVERLINGD